MDFPDIGIQNINMSLRSAVSASSSPFTYNQQVYVHQGVVWMAEVTLPPLRNTASSSTVDFTYPKGTWRLSTNEINFNIAVDGIHSFTFPIIEAL